MSERIRDIINTGPRYRANDVIALNRRFRGYDADEVIAAIFDEGIVGDAVMVSSFGAESVALLHLVANVNPNCPVVFLDTGMHFQETIDYRDKVVDLLGLQDLRIVGPTEAEVARLDPELVRHSYDPDGCCDLRKTVPLSDILKDFDASVTGRKAYQSNTRALLPRFEIDMSDDHGRLKINPLIDWKRSDIIGYMELHNLPSHPLVDQGYASIGCAPCTDRVAEGEDPRSGRWKGFEKTECGIHQSLSASEIEKFDPSI